MNWRRVAAIARKDAAELMRNPGAIFPAVLMVFASLFPAFLVIGLTRLAGQSLEESGDFSEEITRAIGVIPELAGMSGNALAQTFVFHQFSLLQQSVDQISKHLKRLLIGVAPDLSRHSEGFAGCNFRFVKSLLADQQSRETVK